MHSARAVFYTLKASVYIWGIVKAVNKAQAETNFRLFVYSPTKKNVGSGWRKIEARARMFSFMQGERRRQYSEGIVKALNKA